MLDVNRRVVHAAALSVLVLATGCSGDDQPTAAPTATATVTVTQTVTASPSQTETPTEAATSEVPAPTTSNDCAKPTQSVAADWETEDVDFPRQDAVRTRWSDAYIEATFTNNSEHEAVVEFVMFFVSKPRGTHPKPRFPMYSIDSDTQSAEVEPGDSFTPPQQPFGLRDWMDQFPIYTKQEPRVSVSFDWHYKDDDAQAACVDEPARTVPVGKKPRVLSNEPWITSARFTKTGLHATARYCAGDTNDVLEGSRFYAEDPDGTKVEPTASNSPTKVPVAAHQCRSITLEFKNVTGRDWTIAHPYWEDDVPLRWTLARR